MGRTHEKSTTVGAPLAPARARRWILSLGVVLLVAIALSAFLSIRPLGSGRSELGQVSRDDLATHQVGDLRTTLADWQLFIEQHVGLLSASAAKIDPVELATGALLITSEQTQVRAIMTSLDAVGLARPAAFLASESAYFQSTVSDLGPLLGGASKELIRVGVVAMRNGFTRMWLATATVNDQLAAITAVDLRQGADHLTSGRVLVLALDVAFGLTAVACAIAFGQRAHRRQLGDRAAMARRTFEEALQQALDMAPAEPAVYDVLRQAVSFSVPDLRVEMLVADSSRAHFRRTFTTAADGDELPGCGVVSPTDCPATVRAHTLLFPTSRALEACPQLKQRPSGDCSAVCVPMSVAGKTVGVAHATGLVDRPPTAVEIRYLEIAARRASERIAMVRAFEKSELQASSDPLTGLLNRRSLENLVRELQRDGTTYMVAYGDIDHFKSLNDTHGHEAGDQALRLFSRVARDSIRPNDVVARYGGEEFVIVLPSCTTQAAVAVIERLREHLALALTSGRTPAFTISFGLASSTHHDTFDAALASADLALLDAKEAGRNRVTVADEPPTRVAQV